ncbi:divergent polysaccharide deacetylase family protein [Gorillibacterium sp. sgz5001074]|uniref:divergent polysaccharide deacetylase family protein n=1 Tax=Gorillibacterium sp. sgz5001074 TaxID=3446695 RepID=UPI003F6671BB
MSVRKIGLGLGIAAWMLLAGITGGAGPVLAEAPAVTEDPPFRQETPRKKAAIVIDDFGNKMQGTEDMMELPVPFTAAVMPFLPTTKQDAELAHSHGVDVIIHMPMEPVKGKRSWLGPGAITTDLPDDEIRRRVIAAVEDVPYAVGMNNHMGSKATADPRVMRIVLEVCKERNLYFLDSRTSGKSVIGKLCAELGVKTVSNQLFFDEVYTFEHINKQMKRFKTLVDKRDVCIAIGHVGPPGKKTAFVLKKSLPDLKDRVEFVPVSSLVQ